MRKANHIASHQEQEFEKGEKWTSIPIYVGSTCIWLKTPLIDLKFHAHFIAERKQRHQQQQQQKSYIIHVQSLGATN